MIELKYWYYLNADNVYEIYFGDPSYGTGGDHTLQIGQTVSYLVADTYCKTMNRFLEADG